MNIFMILDRPISFNFCINFETILYRSHKSLTTLDEMVCFSLSFQIALGDENSASIFTVGSEPVSVYYKGFNFPCWDGSNLVTTVENQVRTRNRKSCINRVISALNRQCPWP